MILSDFHTHSSNSGDSETKMQFQIESAIKKGIQHLCITEHMDFDYPQVPAGHESEECSFILNASDYYNEYLAMKDKYEKNNNYNSNNDGRKFNLYFGVELGLQEQISTENEKFSKSYPFDFIIASSHTLYKLDPYYEEFWYDLNETTVISDYFKSIYENICLFNNFDIYGHLDYIIRYSKGKDLNFKYADFSDEIDTVLKKIIEMGKGIEINTGGLKNGLKYPNPNPDILKRYKEFGGEIITIGSDAHTPEYIAWKFDIAEAVLKDCGFKYYTTFANRKPEFHNL